MIGPSPTCHPNPERERRTASRCLLPPPRAGNRRWRQRIVHGRIGSLLVALAASLAGCGSESKPASTPRPLRIAVIPKATNHEYWKSIHAGAIKAERELPGVQILWKGPLKEDDREQQINVVENFINAGVDGIVLAPLDETALIRPVLGAKKAGIPVVIMDSGLKAEAGRDFVSYVATDNYGGGQKAGRHLGALLGGKGNVVVLRYLVGSASTSQREDGCLDALTKEFPGVRILSSDQYGGPTMETLYDKAQNLFGRFGEVDGVFSALEPGAFGALRALRDAGKAGRVKLVGFDPSPKLVEALKAGEIHGIVLQDPLRMGYLAVRTVVAHLRGEHVPARIDTGSEVATPQNRDEPRIRELLSPPIDEYLR